MSKYGQLHIRDSPGVPTTRLELIVILPRSAGEVFRNWYEELIINGFELKIEASTEFPALSLLDAS